MKSRLQKDIAPDPQLRQQIVALAKAYDEATDRHDPTAIGALFTEDGIFVQPAGPLNGRQAIEEWYRDLFQGWKPKNHLSTVDPDSPHLIGTAGDTFWVTGGWSETGQGQGGEAVPLQGYWSAIYTREGEDWKLRMLTVNVTPPPAASASPMATPGSP
jgi:uncharacterized protein (TIGR02246 family)